MKKITVKEAIENGLKKGDEVWIKGEVCGIDKVDVNIPLKVSFGHFRHWFADDNEVYLPEAVATTEPKLEVGQYWHHPESGIEWEVTKLDKGVVFLYHCKCTKAGGIWLLGEISKWDIKNIISCGYALGRHPDNIETEWQPKEGELVWNAIHKLKCRVFDGVYSEGLRWAGCDLRTGDWHSSSDFDGCEPYTNQDAKIDFSKTGQWLKCGDNIVEVIIDCDSHCFYGEYLGGVTSCKFSKDLRWKLLTSEQMQPLLDAIAALMESRSD
jgi:hypothetical protein